MRWGPAGGPVCRPYGEQQALSRNGGRGNSLFPLSRCARHLPLIRGVVLPYDSQEYLLGLGRGGPWASRQDSDRCRWLGYPGAEVEPHQRQFLHPQGPVARREFRPATQILRAGNFSRVYRRTSPVMGSGESGPMGTKCPSAASPVAFWLLCRHGQSNSPPAGGEISSADNEPNPNPVPSSVTASPCHLSLSPLSLRDISP